MNTSRLVEEISGLCRSRMLAEKWLIAPSRRIGNQWAECVARNGQAAVNLRIKTLRSLATELAGQEMVARKVALVSEQAGPLLIDQVFRRLKAGLRYLGSLPASAGLAETMFRSIQDIRLAGLTPEQVVPRRFEVSAKGQDLLQILGGYLDELKTQGLVDYAGVLQLAIARVQNAPDDFGTDVVVVCPSCIRLKPLEKQLLDSFPKDRVCRLPVDEPHGKEDEASEAGSSLDLLRWLPHPDLAPAKEPDGTVEIFRATGEVNEVREVLRRLLASKTKLDEAELLYTDAETYVPLIFETIAAQSACDSVGDEAFPATFADGIPTTYSRPGRLLSAWVAWIAEDYPQARLVRMIAEGLLKVPDAEEQGFSFARLASVFRSVGIGLRRDRYLPKLDEEIEALEQRVKDARAAESDDPEDIVRRLQSAERRLAEMKILRQLVEGSAWTCLPRRQPTREPSWTEPRACWRSAPAPQTRWTAMRTFGSWKTSAACAIGWRMTRSCRWTHGIGWRHCPPAPASSAADPSQVVFTSPPSLPAAIPGGATRSSSGSTTADSPAQVCKTPCSWTASGGRCRPICPRRPAALRRRYRTSIASWLAFGGSSP